MGCMFKALQFYSVLLQMGYYSQIQCMQCFKLRVWEGLRISKTIQILISCILLVHIITCIVWTIYHGSPCPFTLHCIGGRWGYPIWSDSHYAFMGTNSSQSEMKQSGGFIFKEKKWIPNFFPTFRIFFSCLSR